MATEGSLNFRLVGLCTCLCVLLAGCASTKVPIIAVTTTPVLDGKLNTSTLIQNTLNISFEQYDTHWRDWLKTDYIHR